MSKYIDFSELVGLTLDSLRLNADDSIITITSGSRTFKMEHLQDCCESVYVESIVGDIDDVLNSPIVVAEVSTQDVDCKDGDEMWTFYKLDTVKGGITIRWNGQSNGWYSIEVDFREVK